MIIIPIHIFLDDKPINIPKILDEKYFGIKRRNIQNAVNKKTALSEDSKKKAYKKISSFCDDIPGLTMVASEEEFSGSITALNPIKFLNCIQDDYTQYYKQIVKGMYELDAQLESEVEKIKTKPPNTQVGLFWELLSDTNFPGTMFKGNLFEETNNKIQNIQITLRRIMVDVLFYILTAYEVEYNHHFLKRQNGDKPLFLKFLPFYHEKTLQNPSKLWFDRLQMLNGFETLQDFARAIPQLSVPPTHKDIDSQKRMLRKWRSGKDKELPSWENINSIAESIVKKQNLSMDDLESYQEQCRFAYAYVKIFQKLSNRLMDSESQELFGMDNIDVIEFFERYLYWHNYHAVLFMETSINTCP